MPKISNLHKEQQKPSFVKVLTVSEDSTKDSLPSFYVYTGVGAQSVVFKRKWEEISPLMLDEDDSVNVSKISGQEVSFKKNAHRQSPGDQLASIEADDMIRKIDEEVKIEGQNDAAIFNKQVKEKLNEIEGENSNRSGGEQNDYLSGINDPAVSYSGNRLKKDQQAQNPITKRSKEKEVSLKLVYD